MTPNTGKISKKIVSGSLIYLFCLLYERISIIQVETDQCYPFFRYMIGAYAFALEETHFYDKAAKKGSQVFNTAVKETSVYCKTVH